MNSHLPVVGQTAEFARTFSQGDVERFAVLTGDSNPVHLDATAAREAGFAGTIVHGSLVGSLISRILGIDLPGPGTVYLAQDLAFKRPIYPGTEVIARVEVTSVRPDKPVVELRTWIESNGEVAIDGRAVVLVRSVDASAGQGES